MPCWLRSRSCSCSSPPPPPHNYLTLPTLPPSLPSPRRYRKKLIDHRGIFRPVGDFKLAKKELAADVDVGFRSEAERANAIIKKNVAKFEADSGMKLGSMANVKSASGKKRAAGGGSKGKSAKPACDSSDDDFEKPHRKKPKAAAVEKPKEKAGKAKPKEKEKPKLKLAQKQKNKVVPAKPR